MSKLTQPTITRSGRVSKPTFKVRELIKNTVHDVWRRLAHQLGEVELKIRRYIQEGRSDQKIKSIYANWLVSQEEFHATEDEYAKLLSPEEATAHSATFNRLLTLQKQLIDDVEHYLLAPKPTERRLSGKVHGILAAETSRIEREIHLIESRLSSSRDAGRKTSESTHRLVNGSESPFTGSSIETDEESFITWPSRISAADSREPRDLNRQSREVEREASSTADALNRLAELLSERKEKLPQIEPEPFGGELMEFTDWMTAFETYIENKTSVAHERLYYLSKYTCGDAKDCISGLLKMKTSDAYTRAKATLCHRFGNKYRIAEAYRRKLVNWPVLKKGDARAMMKLSDYLWQCEAAMSNIGHLGSLDSIDEIAKVVKVLPAYMADRWDRQVDRWCYSSPPDFSAGDIIEERAYPPFVELCKFVAQESRIINGPTRSLLTTDEKVSHKSSSSRGAVTRAAHKSTVHATCVEDGDESETTGSMFEEPEVDETSDGETEVTVLATAAVAGASESRGADRSKTPAKPRCFYCKGEHWIPKCPTFMAMPAEERKEFASEGGLCFGCLRRSHSYRHCRSRDPSLLSDEKKTEKATTLRTIAAEPDRAKIEENFLSSVVLVEICHPAQPEIKHLTYALLDSQSDSCFVSDEVLNKLSPPTAAVELQLTTMGASTKIKSDLVAGLQMRGAANSEMIDLPRCYSRGAIPMNRDAIPRAEDLIQWDHLKEVAARLPEYRPDVSVGLLVGFNCPAVFIPRSCQQNGDDKPFAVNTALGWVVMGATGGRVAEQAVVHRTSVKDVKMVELVRAFDLEFQEPANSDVKVSQDDVLFEKRISESLHQLDDGRYEMDLPFRSEPVDVPNNRPMAMKRLQHLKKKLLKKPEFCARYQEFMTEMLTKGYAEIVDTEPEPGRVMYTPHHGVESASKPGKVRPVFDGGATFEGVSLNSLLLAGSEDPNNLSGVLCNFRDERIGFMCDVKAMFYQVRVTERHRDFLRFLWFAEGDPNGDVIECRMCVHVFGATSSPSCANVAFRQNAIDQAAEYGEEVVQFIQRQFYVDDGLGSRSHADQVVKLFTDSHDLCKTGGFHLCKFACNDPEVIARIPEELLGEAAKTWVVSGRDAPVQTSLGLIWDMIRDAFRFTVQQMMNQMTRRGMLSALCSIYDPLGLISPVILVGCLILQSLCGLSLSWDDAVPVEVADKWRSWYTELQDLEKISIPRCVRTVTSGCQVTVELHHFSDASTLGYGVCSYIRLTNEEGKSDVNLLYSKARVAPKKAVSIPRMELQGAVLAVKVAEFLQRELIYPDITHHFWCDSKVALGYIKNSTRRFQMYVANRVTRIRESSCPEQWSYVNTDENPADLASRGVSPAQLAECDLWWHGPIFVAQGISPDDHDEMIELSDDPEVKRSAVSCKTLVTEEQPLERLINRLSSWRKIVRVVAICRGFVRRLRARANGDALSSLTILQAITVADIQHCEMLMVKIVQRRVFRDEYEVLAEPLLSSASRDEHRARKRSLKQSSKMYQLDAFVDEQGMIRVGGRLGNANVPYHVRHPLLLPRDHRATYLIASREHQKCGHLGRQSTLAHLRESGFWVISGRVVVDRCTRACILCKKLKAPCMEQKMADLPLDRTEDAPPFTYSGVDVFGPYLVKEGRSYKKRWVCIFVCMMIRCAHLEPLHALTTDSFLHAFRRFINRRGAVKMLRSDCGTNFVGAENEMQNAKLEMDEDVVKNELSKLECEWTTMKFNCPKASHMGGVWERPIASIKSVFNSILHRHPDQLNDEIFHTFLTEAEGIYNSRPITPVDMSDPLAESPLCPANLLTLKRSNVRALPGKFPAEDVYSRRHWRRVQHFRQEFMCRWRREFLLSLQTRKKWGRTMKNLEVDDLVLLSDDEKKREDWSLGLVTSVERNADDLVRKAKIRTAAGEFYRPIHKLVYLLSPREDPVDV